MSDNHIISETLNAFPALATTPAVPFPPEARALLDGAVPDARIARLIDHTLLKPEATREQIETLCDEAARYGFASVCVNPGWVPLAAGRLADSQVMVCTVIGFPLGATSTGAKVAETHIACEQGADEVDMVLAIGKLRGGELADVGADIHAVAEAAHAHGTRLKVIIETILLDERQKVQACTLVRAAGADFVKTSTGFSGGGATVEDIALMRRVVGHSMGVKASGGVRSLADAVAMIRVGATRIGASAGVQIVEEAGGESWQGSTAQSSGY